MRQTKIGRAIQALEDKKTGLLQAHRAQLDGIDSAILALRGLDLKPRARRAARAIAPITAGGASAAGGTK